MNRYAKKLFEVRGKLHTAFVLAVVCMMVVCEGGVAGCHARQAPQEAPKQDAKKTNTDAKQDTSRYKELKAQVDALDTRVTFSFYTVNHSSDDEGDLKNIEGCLKQENAITFMEKKLDILTPSKDSTSQDITEQELSKLQQAVQAKKEEFTKNVRTVLEQELNDASEMEFGGVPLSHRSLLIYQDRLERLPQYVDKLSTIVNGTSESDTWKEDFLKQVDASTARVNSALSVTPLPPKSENVNEEKNYPDTKVMIDLPYATFETTEKATKYCEFGHAHYWKQGVVYDEYAFLSKTSFYIEEDGSGRACGGDGIWVTAVSADVQVEDHSWKSGLTSDGKYKVFIGVASGEQMAGTAKIK